MIGRKMNGGRMRTSNPLFDEAGMTSGIGVGVALASAAGDGDAVSEGEAGGAGEGDDFACSSN